MAVRVHTSEPSWVEATVGLLSLAGLADSILLTVEHYKAIGLPCTFTQGCETVLTSQYASIGPLPTSALGIIFYGLILFAVIYALSNRSALPRLPLLAWASLGFLSSLGLTYIQAFVLHAWCQYCLLSALSSTLIFIVSLVAYLARRRAPVAAQEESTDDQDEA